MATLKYELDENLVIAMSLGSADAVNEIIEELRKQELKINPTLTMINK